MRKTYLHYVVAAVGALVAFVLISRCATVSKAARSAQSAQSALATPVSGPAPVVGRPGCWFEMIGGRRLFDYVLVTVRGNEITQFALRNPYATTVRRMDDDDGELRVRPSREIRMGFCPDEAAAMNPAAVGAASSHRHR